MQASFGRQATPDETMRAVMHTISLLASNSPSTSTHIEGWHNFLTPAEIQGLRNAEAGLLIARIRYHRTPSDDLLARCESARKFSFSLSKRLKLAAADRVLDEQRRMAMTPALCWKVMRKLRCSRSSVPIHPETLIDHFLDVFL